MTNRRDDLRQLVETSKGLAHPARLRLLAMLEMGELCVCQMTAVLELASSTVSQHLSVLARGGLVADRKQGRLELGEWLATTWSFTKQILPLLLAGVLAAGLLLGRPGHEGLIPAAWGRRRSAATRSPPTSSPRSPGRSCTSRP